MTMMHVDVCLAGVHGDSGRGSGGRGGAQLMGVPHAEGGHQCTPAAVAGCSCLLVSLLHSTANHAGIQRSQLSIC